MRQSEIGQLEDSQRDQHRLFDKYVVLQSYVEWSNVDSVRLAAARPHLLDALPRLVDEFYESVMNCEATREVITGGESQVARLKGSLRASLADLFAGPYDRDFVARRWQIGHRHLQVGLDESFVCAAMSNLRVGFQRTIRVSLPDDSGAAEALDKLLDLDLAIIQDAYSTQRLRLERVAARQQSEQHFQSLVESATVAVLILDMAGRVTYFSPFAEALTGVMAEEIAGRPFADLIDNSEQSAGLLAQLNEAVELGGVRDRELDIRCIDGTRRRWLCNITRLDDYQSQPAVLLVAHDTTDWHTAQERLLRAERLAGIGQMVTGLAHESRNALQRIGSMAEMLELELSENEGALSLVKRLQSAQEDLRKLFDELRSYAAPIQLDAERCGLSACWKEAWELVRHSRAERNARLTEKIMTTNDSAVVDRFRLVQVLRNLFENALTACRDPTEIVVRLRESTLSEETGIELCVSDNGPGIAEQDREQIFEPFYTTHTKGSGLGLAIARRVIEAHGGTIVVTESPLGGAAFLITLPKGVTRS